MWHYIVNVKLTQTIEEANNGRTHSHQCASKVTAYKITAEYVPRPKIKMPGKIPVAFFAE